MSIDAVIDSVRHKPQMTELYLRPRIDRNGKPTIVGRRRLLITKNPAYTPQPSDEIWGNSGEVVIRKDGIDHKFVRVMRLWDGTYRTWQGPLEVTE